MLILTISMCSAIQLYLGTLGTLASSVHWVADPLDEEPPCKRQHQLGKIFNWHIIYESVVNFFFMFFIRD